MASNRMSVTVDVDAEKLQAILDAYAKVEARVVELQNRMDSIERGIARLGLPYKNTLDPTGQLDLNPQGTYDDGIS